MANDKNNCKGLRNFQVCCPAKCGTIEGNVLEQEENLGC